MNVGSAETWAGTTAMILDWVSEYDGPIIALATVVMAASALFTFFLTRALVRENTLLRKAETDPEVVAYLAFHPLCRQYLNFVMPNVGRGPARNVNFEMDISVENREHRNIHLGHSVDRRPISFLPQGEVFTVFFCDWNLAFEDSRLPPFNINIDFEDLVGERRRRTCVLDVEQFRGYAEIGNPPEKDIVDSLYNIQQHLGALERPINDLGDIRHFLEILVRKRVDPPSVELTEEAKTILKTSVTRFGTVHNREYGRDQNIDIGGQLLIPDQHPRTIATWFGGLKDLRQRGYIEDVSHKGEVFKITREGYTAADKLA